VAANLILLGEAAPTLDGARQMADEKRADGSAWERFRALVAAQGGDVSFVDDPGKLPAAEFVEAVVAERTGFLKAVDARVVGETSVELGAGREKKGDRIDHAVGIIVHGKVGDNVQEGQPLFTVHANSAAKLGAGTQRLLSAIEWSEGPVDPLPLFYGEVK
jgi:pyrimidine-nucleoside phosphorylase